MTNGDGDRFGYIDGFARIPAGKGYSINGLEHSWIDGEATLEWPSHLFAGFGARPTFRAGAFTYSASHISPHVAEIGRYCSIASGVTFGHQEHATGWLSTSSFTYDSNFMGPAPETPLPGSLFRPSRLPAAKKRERITIGNDVWIGFDAYIRGGVHLGNGCIVGAHAVVTKDVPPYAIVAGNPARIIRFRFNRGIVRQLEELQWWRFAFTDFDDIDISDVAGAISRLRRLFEGGLAPFEPMTTILSATEPTPALQATLVSGPVPEPSCRTPHP